MRCFIGNGSSSQDSKGTVLHHTPHRIACFRKNDFVLPILPNAIHQFFIGMAVTFSQQDPDEQGSMNRLNGAKRLEGLVSRIRTAHRNNNGQRLLFKRVAIRLWTDGYTLFPDDGVLQTGPDFRTLPTRRDPFVSQILRTMEHQIHLVQQIKHRG